jgi:hypothetical protein
MEFIVDKETKTVSITKEFVAELSLVWDAYFPEPETSRTSGVPKPLASRTKVYGLQEGGGPEIHTRWSAPRVSNGGAFRNIPPLLPKANFKFFNALSTRMKNLNCQVPVGSEFKEQGGTQRSVSRSIANRLNA